MSTDRLSNQAGNPNNTRGELTRKYLLGLAWFVLLSALFALAYNQAPLFTSNQNQYFLHGYAQAGYGNLAEDWLANTADPTPVFSFLVAGTIRLFHTGNVFYIYYAFLLGIYFFSLWGIVEQVFQLRASKLKASLFTAAIILLHSTVLRYLLQRFFGGDWSYLFEGGVAGQRLLGVVFQPSTFGVFLLLSIALYLRGKNGLAVLSAALAATFHPTYLLSAAALTLGYIFDTFRSQNKLRPAIRLGILAVITIAPILVYTFITFWGGNPRIDQQARDILVNIRIPAHTLVSVWFNASVVIKLLFLFVALFLVRNHRLFTVLLVPLCMAVLLSMVQVLSKNTTLALLFPWRLSTWLVPVSTGLIAGWIVTWAAHRVPVSKVGIFQWVTLGLIGLAAGAGIFRTYLENQAWAGLPYRPLEAYVKSHLRAGEQYLTPSSIYDFRLETGAPVYVDFLSIPYKSAEVLEWDGRFRQESYYYQEGDCKWLSDFISEGVNRVVLPATFPSVCPQLIEIHSDPAYKLYQLNP